MTGRGRLGWQIPAVLTVSVLGAGACAGDDSSSTSVGGTGALPQCGMLSDKASCEMEVKCEWNVADLGGYCIVECDMIDDQMTCDDQPFCGWENGACAVVVEA